MSDLRTEHAAREAESWARFAAALDRIPRDRWDGSEVLPGWTVKDLLWHMAWWLDKCARNLEHIRTGTGEAVWPAETVDEVNAKLVTEVEDLPEAHVPAVKHTIDFGPPIQRPDVAGEGRVAAAREGDGQLDHGVRTVSHTPRHAIREWLTSRLSIRL